MTSISETDDEFQWFLCKQKSNIRRETYVGKEQQIVCCDCKQRNMEVIKSQYIKGMSSFEWFLYKIFFVHICHPEFCS